MAEWQEIKTAPKDGTPIILAVPLRMEGQYGVGEGRWIDASAANEVGWWWAGESPGDYTGEPIHSYHGWATHWMPMPPPPSP